MARLQPDPVEKKGWWGGGGRWGGEKEKKNRPTNSSQIKTIIKVPFNCQGVFLARAKHLNQFQAVKNGIITGSKATGLTSSWETGDLQGVSRLAL